MGQWPESTVTNCCWVIFQQNQGNTPDWWTATPKLYQLGLQPKTSFSPQPGETRSAKLYHSHRGKRPHDLPAVRAHPTAGIVGENMGTGRASARVHDGGVSGQRLAHGLGDAEGGQAGGGLHHGGGRQRGALRGRPRTDVHGALAEGLHGQHLGLRRWHQALLSHPACHAASAAGRSGRCSDGGGRGGRVPRHHAAQRGWRGGDVAISGLKVGSPAQNVGPVRGVTGPRWLRVVAAAAAAAAAVGHRRLTGRLSTDNDRGHGLGGQGSLDLHRGPVVLLQLLGQVAAGRGCRSGPLVWVLQLQLLGQDHGAQNAVAACSNTQVTKHPVQRPAHSTTTS